MYLLVLLVSSAHCACDFESPSGPFRLETFKPPDVEVSQVTHKVARFMPGADKEKLIIGYRALWRSYCYNGGSLDQNTGCYTSLTPVPPSRSELEEWASRGECQYGPRCTDCWGSDSRVCLTKIDPTGSWTSRRELVRRETNYKFAYHMCNQDWRCGLDVSDAFFDLEWDLNGVVVDTKLPNGSVVRHRAGSTAFWSSGQFSYLATGPSTLTKETVEINCFYDCSKCGVHNQHRGDLFCQDGPRFFKVEKSKFCFENVCYDMGASHANAHGKFQNKFKNVSSSEIPDHSRGDSDPNVALLAHKASIEDLRSLMLSQMYELEGLKVTLASIDARFQRLTDILNKIVLSVAKVDDRLIGELLAKKMASKFLTEKEFLLFKCLSPIGSDTNCYGDVMFRDGRWVKKTDTSMCVNLTETDPVGINLFNFTGLWYPTPEEVHFRGVVEDEEGWSFVAKTKEDLLKTMMLTHKGGMGTSLQDVLEYPKGWLTHQIGGLVFGGIGTYLLYGIGIVVLFVVLRRAHVL
ncbi:glycoprotein [Jos virus]|uniref:Glycoprotein n=1 Tax=Jos virus TaxID=1027466 RepID=H6SW53_9ORTO|nr:glycoprotein [Jos virus]AED98372.1 glycoprotein [Jos virus]